MSFEKSHLLGAVERYLVTLLRGTMALDFAQVVAALCDCPLITKISINSPLNLGFISLSH